MEAIVEYNYVAQEPDELTIRKGDVIKEIKVMLGGWWEGTLRDKRGMFPDNFVKVLEPSSGGAGAGGGGGGGGGAGGGGEGTISTKSEEVSLRNGATGRRWCKVLFSYDPCNEDELTLVPQETIEFLGEVEEGWWRGRLRGRVGVFPSNFVSPPSHEEQDKSKERDKRELCRVLFPYEASNEDELTLLEGDVITLLSRDALDKGWWKGEVRGHAGLFPDNFVEILGPKNEHQDQEQRYESSQMTARTSTKHSLTSKKSEKAHARRSLDLRNTQTDVTRRVVSTSSSSSLSSSAVIGITGGSGDKKPSGSQLLVSSLKRLVDGSSNSGNNTSGNSGLGEELDGVERGEGAPLSHLTASRAKAPRRRPPSTQHLRHHTSDSTATTTTTTVATTVVNTGIMEESLANGSSEISLEQLREDDGDSPVGKTRRKAPWVEELKMNQLERRKIVSADRVDKVEVKKERNYSRISAATNVIETGLKSDVDSEDNKPKERERGQRVDSSGTEHLTPSPLTPGPLAYVPYHLYNQLLERIAVLEEKQTTLQRTVTQLSEQLAPLLANSSSNNKL